MAYHNLLFVIYAQTFQITYTNHIYLYSPPSLGISTIAIYVIASGMSPSRNASFVKLASLSHRHVSGSVSHVTPLNHPFRCSSLVPNMPPTCTVRSPPTATAIPSPFGSLSRISTGYISIRIAVPSYGCLMWRFSFRVYVCSIP